MPATNLVDPRTVWLPPSAGETPDDGREVAYHTSRECAGGGAEGEPEEVLLEKATKEGFRPCIVCAPTTTLPREAF